MPTACKAPKSLLASLGSYESAFVLRWSEGESGTYNDITRYTIQCRFSPQRLMLDNWVTIYSVKPNQNAFGFHSDYLLQYGIRCDRGFYYQFRIRTEGSAGEYYYSGWTESDIIRLNHCARIYDPDLDTDCMIALIYDGYEFMPYIPYRYDGEVWRQDIDPDASVVMATIVDGVLKLIVDDGSVSASINDGVLTLTQSGSCLSVATSKDNLLCISKGG